MKMIRKRKRTYKRQLMMYCLLAITVISTIMLIHTSMNENLIHTYQSSYQLYQKLGDFYETQSLAHDSVKNFLYTKSEKEYDSFLEKMAEAKVSLSEIQEELVDEDRVFRFHLLANMVTSYEQQADRVILLRRIQDSAYSQSYNDLLDINELIIQSSDDYYQVVTNEMEITLDDMEGLNRTTDLFSVVVFFMGVIGIMVFTYFILKSITNPIDDLVDNLEDIKAGSFDFHKIPSSSEEIDVLSKALQDLSDHIHKNIQYEKEKVALVNKLLLKENENLRKDELLISSELKILQNQINPHFLFNAMNMIYQQAIIEDSTITMEMIEKMTECMRYTLNQNYRTSTLEMELNFVENYIYIQNKRFEGRIHFELTKGNDLPTMCIPSMIIEPLIDNSVKHGLSNTESDGLVTIHVEADDEYLRITVSDNGKGLEAEKLEELEMNELKVGNEEDNLGLFNISKRLSVYFSEKSTIRIHSVEDCGFETIITLPITK